MPTYSKAARLSLCGCIWMCMKPEGVIPHCFGDSEERNSMIELLQQRNRVRFNNEAERQFFYVITFQGNTRMS